MRYCSMQIVCCLVYVAYYIYINVEALIAAGVGQRAGGSLRLFFFWLGVRALIDCKNGTDTEIQG